MAVIGLENERLVRNIREQTCHEFSAITVYSFYIDYWFQLQKRISVHLILVIVIACSVAPLCTSVAPLCISVAPLCTSVHLCGNSVHLCGTSVAPLCTSPISFLAIPTSSHFSSV
jgi:hypothetical protein